MKINETSTGFDLVFGKDAHGFKLSPQYSDRMYYYPDDQYSMDVAKIPKGRWKIDKVISGHISTIVKISAT